MLRRGRTTTSLSVPGYESTSTTIRCAMDVLRSQGLHLDDLSIAFPNLEQISVGRSRRCLENEDYDPMWCMGDSAPFDTQTYFGTLLSNAKVCTSLPSAQAARSAKAVSSLCRCYLSRHSIEVVHCRWWT